MLKKLRAEKKQYNFLLKEKFRLYEEVSMTSQDNTSNYTLEFKDLHPTETKAAVNSKFKRTVRVHATVNRDVHLPKINNASLSKPNQQSKSMEAFAVGQQQGQQHQQRLIDENDLSRLLSLRTRMQELRDFVNSCKESVNRRPWNRVEKR
jgi:hypothetical protein